jgi:hypothetical protein
VGGFMNVRTGAAVAVVLLAVAGCSGGGDDNASAKPSASKGYSKKAETCFVEVIKQVDMLLSVAQGAPSGVENEQKFGAFGVKAQGTPTWDIYKTYSDMAVRDLAQGAYATATDAVAAYAPSVKLECVRAYG